MARVSLAAQLSTCWKVCFRAGEAAARSARDIGIDFAAVALTVALAIVFAIATLGVIASTEAKQLTIAARAWRLWLQLGWHRHWRIFGTLFSQRVQPAWQSSTAGEGRKQHLAWLQRRR